jgi:peptidoglycan/LPS O-acetylase OafA/YrhL
MVAYILFRDLEKSKGRFNPVLLYLHRYIRLTPPFAIAIAIFSTIMPKMYAGPHWSGARATSELCQMDWWRTILYVQTIPSFAPEVSLPLMLESGAGCIGQVSWENSSTKFCLISYSDPVWERRLMGSK